MSGEYIVPVIRDNNIAQRIDLLISILRLLRPVLDLWRGGAVLAFLEYLAHLDGLLTVSVNCFVEMAS